MTNPFNTQTALWHCGTYHVRNPSRRSPPIFHTASDKNRWSLLHGTEQNGTQHYSTERNELDQRILAVKQCKAFLSPYRWQINVYPLHQCVCTVFVTYSSCHCAMQPFLTVWIIIASDESLGSPWYEASMGLGMVGLPTKYRQLCRGCV